MFNFEWLSVLILVGVKLGQSDWDSAINCFKDKFEEKTKLKVWVSTLNLLFYDFEQ